jgi:hypothetical protein
MIPDVFYPIAGDTNWGNTKPPLSVWAVNEVILLSLYPPLPVPPDPLPPTLSHATFPTPSLLHSPLIHSSPLVVLIFFYRFLSKQKIAP